MPQRKCIATLASGRTFDRTSFAGRLLKAGIDPFVVLHVGNIHRHVAAPG